MDITAKMVKELRESSGAGMMDCKKALTECGGDMDKAMDYLHKRKYQEELDAWLQQIRDEAFVDIK